HVFIVVYLVLFQLVAFASKPFRFALFTDTHISTTNPIPTEDLRNAITDVNSLQNIDFVLVDGDVSNSGDTTSLIEAKRLLQTLKIPFYIVAGNHDFHWNTGVGSDNFIHVFGADKFVFTHKKVVFAGFTTVPLNNEAKATIQQADIDWIKKALKKTGKNKTTFIVTHYPLLTGDVENWKDLTDVLHKFNVKAILNGHYHRNVLLNYDGIPGVVNRSTQRAKNPVGGYSIYTVSDSLTVSEKRIGEAEDIWLKLPLNSK
ncbi:MAG TPA: metallophosphoesterase, partial [Paludibacter sp.]